MKTKKALFLLAAIVMIASSVDAYGQASATATATASIVSPIAISRTTDMNFGNVAVSATPGTVVLATGGTRTATGGVTLPATAGTVTAAVFQVTGTPTYTYTITLPTSITIASGTDNMTVNAFVSSPATTGTIGAGGNEDLQVGATLNVAANQAPGTYTNTTDLTVTVNYN